MDGYNIHVGENFYANFDCVVLDVCRVDIGQNYQIGLNVHIYTITHPLNANERIEDPEYGKPVIVGDNVWVGGQAVLNPGVIVGDNAIIASQETIHGFADYVPELLAVQLVY